MAQLQRHNRWPMASDAPDVPEIRRRALHHTDKVVTIRLADLECADRHVGNLVEGPLLDCQHESVLFLRAGALDEAAGQHLHLLLLLTAEPSGSPKAADLTVLHGRVADGRWPPGVHHGPATLLYWFLTGAPLHHAAPVGRHKLHVHADLLQQVIGDIPKRPDRCQVRRADQHGLLTLVAGSSEHFPRLDDIRLHGFPSNLHAIAATAGEN